MCWWLGRVAVVAFESRSLVMGGEGCGLKVLLVSPLAV